MSDCADNVTPAICFEGVSFSYGAKLALEDADFDIYAGESVCIIGPNGGGKSTLLKLALGLLQPADGSIKILGKDPKDARPRVGYVPQSIAYDPLFPVKAYQVVMMGQLDRRSLFFARGTQKKKAIEALERMGLASIANQNFSSLSGGQRQGVLIARALVCEAELLFLDEPTSNIDVAGESRLMERLEALRNELTVITVSHDLTFVTRSVLKVVCVSRCVHVHPTKELSRERLRALYGNEIRLVAHDHEHLDSHGGHHHG